MSTEDVYKIRIPRAKSESGRDNKILSLSGGATSVS